MVRRRNFGQAERGDVARLALNESGSDSLVFEILDQVVAQRIGTDAADDPDAEPKSAQPHRHVCGGASQIAREASYVLERNIVVFSIEIVADSSQNADVQVICHWCAASLAAVTCRVRVPTMGDFPFAHLA